MTRSTRYMIVIVVGVSVATFGRLYGVLSPGEQVVLPIVFGMLALASDRRRMAASLEQQRANKA